MLFEQKDAAYRRTALYEARGGVALEARELAGNATIGFEGARRHAPGRTLGKVADVYKKFDINAEAVVRDANYICPHTPLLRHCLFF